MSVQNLPFAKLSKKIRNSFIVGQTCVGTFGVLPFSKNVQIFEFLSFVSM